jgi:hypothetical protein
MPTLFLTNPFHIPRARAATKNYRGAPDISKYDALQKIVAINYRTIAADLICMHMLLPNVRANFFSDF